MDEDTQRQFQEDIHRGAAILSGGGTDWEMVKNPEPILFVLARQAVASSNDWTPGGNLIEDLVALRRPDSKYFNPHGWLGKEITDIRGGTKKGSSAAIGRWAPYVERSASQPYRYRLASELYQCLIDVDFGALGAPAERSLTQAPASMERAAVDDVAEAVGFIYETHLQEYMERCWKDLAGKMGLDGFELAERDCGSIGVADIVARRSASDQWAVVELKRSDVVDVAIGQVTRYMSWVSAHRARGAPVRGILVGREFDEKTRYSARVVPGLSLWRYALSFDLHPDMPTDDVSDERRV